MRERAVIGDDEMYTTTISPGGRSPLPTPSGMPPANRGRDRRRTLVTVLAAVPMMVAIGRFVQGTPAFVIQHPRPIMEEVPMTTTHPVPMDIPLAIESPNGTTTARGVESPKSPMLLVETQTPTNQQNGTEDEESSTNDGLQNQHRRHSCLNADFSTAHDRAVATLLIPTKEEYMVAASVLGASLVIQPSANQTDRVILELRHSPLTRYQWARLQRAGWTHKCTIDPVPARRRPSPRFVDQFAKLRVWGMTVYDVVVYMDADTLVLGNIDDLLHVQFENDQKIGVTADFRIDYGTPGSGGAWADTFNMGVFAIRPDWAEYERLLRMQRDDDIQVYEHIMAEQGWLNAVYKDQWKDIGLIYNANVAARDHSRFQEKYGDLRIIHYTTMKPWFKDDGTEHYKRLCLPWVEIRDQILPQYGCTNEDFVPPTDNRFAMFTFLTDTVEKASSTDRNLTYAEYTYGAAALIKSIQEHAGIHKVDTVLLEIPTRRLPDADRSWLKQLGWNICTVSPIRAKHTPFGRFIDQFNKFHIWSFVEYDKIVYLDSDTLVTGTLDGLLERNLTDGKRIAVTQDFFGTRFVETFNMGVFLIEPNLTEFHRLMKLQANDDIKYDTPQAEQGFLNAVYKDMWEEIGIEYNANMAVWVNKRDAWPENPKIKHYTLEKPWQEHPPTYRSASGDVLDAFLKTWKEAAKTYGVWPYDR